MRFLFVLASAMLPLWSADPRPEYPQPQFERQLWQSLNGAWEFEFDDANKGLAEGWARADRKLSKTITVPFAFETKLSGIGDTSFHPWVWYRRSVSIPAEWKGRHVLLHFGAVDYHATVWVNGQKAGEHEGGSVPFHFDITPLLKAGQNTIVLRAWDPPADRTIPRGKQYWEPKSRGIFYTRTTGIWQPVWLEATGAAYLKRVRANAAANGDVRMDAISTTAPDGALFFARISRNGQNLAEGSVAFKNGRASLGMHVNDPQLWNVGQPNLYDVAYELRQGSAASDTVRSYIGFRTVNVESGRVHINGRPVYLKMILDQGYWPESTLTAPTDEAFQFDIKATMEMGFNGARKHQKVEDPRFLYWADKMGFLVSGEIANAYRFDEQYVDRFTREWIEAVERDFNHPSIVMWIPINESWGVHDLHDPRQQDHLRANYYLTKSLDPTRPVIDNDGWEHVETTDLFGIHDYTPNGEALYSKYASGQKKGEPFPPNGRAAMAPGNLYNGSPIFLSEFGGIAYIPANVEVPSDSWGYSGVEKTVDSAMQRLDGIYKGIRKLPQIIGICYTQLTDVEQEVNGLLTYDRKMKFDAKKIKEMNDSLR